MKNLQLHKHIIMNTKQNKFEDIKVNIKVKLATL